MKDPNFDVEDLAGDPRFKQVILNPDEHAVQFWNQWRALSPAHELRYQRARLLVLAVTEKYDEPVSDEEVELRLSRLEQKRLDRTGRTDRKIGKRVSWWWAAAGLLVAGGLAIGILRLNGPFSADSPGKDTFATGGLIRAEEEAGAGLVIRENKTGANLTLMLNDSSVVTLFPGGVLKFPGRFDGAQRKVELVGDAFFEITPNPEKPFLVFARETVVKVLGTSFRVRALQNDHEVRVSVTSGRVSVFRASDFEDVTSKRITDERAGLVLVPHEEAIMNRQTLKLKKSGLKSGLSPGRQDLVQELIFDDTSIADVFHALEKTYGMEIEFDEDASRKCPITTYFREESLLERINTICQAVGATYRPENGKIIVTGIDCTSY
ncbi:FecR family protein [Ravibacter arvi]|uniref:FecR family protein n=1 Tax=Ravibacter arvi TaxID=2051041 RepID=A0ABP8MCN0_9BACT